MQSTHSPEDIQRHVRGYYLVFFALLVLTGITVVLAKLHLPIGKAVALALAVASVKAGLVAGYFMHLLTERQVLYSILALTGFFFALLLMLPSLTTFVH